MSTPLLNDASIIQDAILSLFRLYSQLDCLYFNVETIIAHVYDIFLSGKARTVEYFNAFLFISQAIISQWVKAHGLHVNTEQFIKCDGALIKLKPSSFT